MMITVDERNSGLTDALPNLQGSLLVLVLVTVILVNITGATPLSSLLSLVLRRNSTLKTRTWANAQRDGRPA